MNPREYTINNTRDLLYTLAYTIYYSPLSFLLCRNHLDSSTVDWLVEYLTNLTDTTVITVSHDTPFMERICTDIIHYEQRDVWGPHRKLVHYKGKMSEFVKRQPQAKHYFELATTDLKFKFPDPGE